MATTRANKGKSKNVTIIKKMRDYSKEPAFVKKAEKAVAFLKKHGLPKPLTKKG